MSWLFDHANVVYVLLGIVALGFVTAWWLNKRVKYLLYGIIPIVLGSRSQLLDIGRRSRTVPAGIRTAL